MKPVVIISPDKDFSQPLAEQVRRRLALDCAVTDDAQAAKAQAEGALAVASGKVMWKGPVIVAEAPVRMQELLSSIEEALKKPAAEEEVSLGKKYRLLPRAKQLAAKAGTMDLTDKEVQLLLTLKSAGKKGIGKERLLKEVWGFSEALDTHTLETHIYRLRAKFRDLGGEEDMIVASSGGYRLAA